MSRTTEHPGVDASSASAISIGATVALGLAVAGGALVSLSGWTFNAPRLADWFGVGISIQSSTSVLLVLGGTALVVAARGRRAALALLGLLMLGASTTTLLQHALGFDLGFDDLLTMGRRWGREATAAPGRMGPPAAISFTLIAIATLLLALPRRPGRDLRRFVPVCALVVLTVVAFSLIGYALGARPLYSVPWMTAIAAQTALLLALLAIGLLTLVPDHLPVLLLRERSGASSMAMVALPILIGVPPLLAWLARAGERRGLYDAGTGQAMAIVAILVATNGLMWWALVALRRREAGERRTTNALRGSEARLRSILEQLPVAVGVLDARGRWTMTNTLMDDILPGAIASTRAESIPLWSGLDPQGRPIPPAEWPGQRALRGERVLPGVEMLYHGHPGGSRWMRISAVPLRDDDGRILGATYVVHDIDVIKRFQQRLESELSLRTDEVHRAAEAIARSRRLAAVGTMAAGLAHDISNVTLPLGLRLGALLADPTTGETARRDLRAVAVLVDHLRQMASDLSLFSRDPEHEGTEGWTDIPEWWRRVRPLIESTPPGGGHDPASRPIVVTFDLADSLPPVAIAPHRLTQMVLNLVHNAHDAIATARADGALAPGAGTIGVHARVDASGEFVLLGVSDDGCGMDEHTRDRALEPFFTTKERPAAAGAGGSGIGLAISHAICQRVGASLSIASAPGRGTTVSVSLPVARGPAAPHPAHAPLRPASR